MDPLKELVLSKACLKQDVFSITKDVFGEFKIQLAAIADELKAYIDAKDPRVLVEYKTNGQFECQIVLGGDTLVFHMHTNVFHFPQDHLIFKSGYAAKDKMNAYCGIIHIYNFLTDSFRYQRLNDSGYLVGRLFVNRERHFFVEGRKQLGYLYNDFSHAVIDQAAVRSVCETALQCALEFDLYTPPFNTIKEVTLDQIQTLSHDLMLKTGKRMGFKFQSESGNPFS